MQLQSQSLRGNYPQGNFKVMLSKYVTIFVTILVLAPILFELDLTLVEDIARRHRHRNKLVTVS